MTHMKWFLARVGGEFRLQLRFNQDAKAEQGTHLEPHRELPKQTCNIAQNNSSIISSTHQETSRLLWEIAATLCHGGGVLRSGRGSWCIRRDRSRPLRLPIPLLRGLRGTVQIRIRRRATGVTTLPMVRGGWRADRGLLISLRGLRWLWLLRIVCLLWGG